MGLDEYLNVLSDQIRNRKAKAAVRKEIKDHILDQAADYESGGMDRDQAVTKAVEQMGDPVEAGVALDRIHRPQMEWKLLGWIVFFSILGLAVQYFCFYKLVEADAFSVRLAGSGWQCFLRQCVYTAIGLVLMAAVCVLDYSVIGQYSRLLAVCFLGGIVFLCMSGVLPEYNGAYSYIKCILYLFIPLYGGILYQYRGKKYGGLLGSMVWIAAVFLIGAKTIGGGLGIIFDVVVVCFLMFLAAFWKDWFGIPKKIGAGAIAAVILIAAMVGAGNLEPYQWRRLQVLVDPENYAETSGFHVIMIRSIVSKLALYGSSFETMVQKELVSYMENLGVPYEYMMLQTAVVLGVVKTAALCLLFAAFLVYLFQLVRKEKNQMGQIMGFGCVMVLTMEVVRNLLNNFGFPFLSTGGMPFLTYGKCHTFAVYILLGFVLSIFRFRNLVWEKRVSAKEKGVIASFGAYRIIICSRPESEP